MATMTTRRALLGGAIGAAFLPGGWMSSGTSGYFAPFNQIEGRDHLARALTPLVPVKRHDLL